MYSAAYGLVAQLGERCVRNAEAEGSIPFESTRRIHLSFSGVFVYFTVFWGNALIDLFTINVL